MAEHGFTPGPWRVDNAGYIVSGPYNVCIPYATKPEDKQLMAASPTLGALAFIESGRIYEQQCCGGGSECGCRGSTYADEATHYLRAAITLATGKDA